ncbi:MAG: MFS transporter, partial [Alphaproteobacteria bacterium]
MGRKSLPAGVWALGFTSLFMDVSSEMIHALLPVYLVTGLGATMLAVGLIEGVAEATALVVKVFSGALSDWLGRRKPLAVLGYGLAAVTKPVFPLAGSLGWIVAARVVDRIGKGIRGAPRDALVADITPEDQRGAAFGLRQALDTVGAFLGPLVAIGLMALSGGNIPLVFWGAVVPAVLSVTVLALFVREGPKPAGKARAPPSRAALGRLGAG